MSFLTTRVPIVARRVKPALVARFSTSPHFQKSPVEAAKDGINKVDRTVSDAAVKGIDKGVEAKNKAQEMAGVAKDKAEGKAEELKGEAKQKQAEVKGKL